MDISYASYEILTSLGGKRTCHLVSKVTCHITKNACKTNKKIMQCHRRVSRLKGKLSGFTRLYRLYMLIIFLVSLRYDFLCYMLSAMACTWETGLTAKLAIEKVYICHTNSVFDT